MSSLSEKAIKAKEKFEKAKVKEPKQKDVKLESLKPPMAPKPVKKEEKPRELVEAVEFKIDWYKVAQSSDFKRAVYLALEDKTFRGKDADLEKELNKKIQVFRDPNFSNVIKELVENFKNGNLKPSQIKVNK